MDIFCGDYLECCEISEEKQYDRTAEVKCIKAAWWKSRSKMYRSSLRKKQKQNVQKQYDRTAEVKCIKAA